MPPVPYIVSHPSAQAQAAQQIARIQQQQAMQQTQQNGGQPPVLTPAPVANPAPQAQAARQTVQAQQVRAQQQTRTQKASVLDVTTKIAPAGFGVMVGGVLDAFTAPVQSLFPGTIPEAKFQFAARPQDMAEGALLGVSLIGAGLTAGAALGIGSAAATAAGSAATTTVRTGGRAAMGYATAAPAATSAGAAAATAAAAGTAIALPLAASELFPIFPNPGPSFPTGQPTKEIIGGHDPFDITVPKSNNNAWVPGRPELGNSPNTSRTTVKPSKITIGTNERISGALGPEIPPSAEAWGLGRAEMIAPRPGNASIARFRAAEAVPNPFSPFGGPSAFPDAFPTFPTGPGLAREEEDNPLVRPVALPLKPDTSVVDAVVEGVRYSFISPPAHAVKPKTANISADLASDLSTDSALSSAFAIAIPSEGISDLSILGPLAKSLATVGAASRSNAADTSVSIEVPEVGNPFVPANPPAYPPGYLLGTLFGPPTSQTDRRREKGKKRSKKTGERGGETSFFEYTPVASVRQFMGIPAPRKRRSRK